MIQSGLSETTNSQHLYLFLVSQGNNSIFLDHVSHWTAFNRLASYGKPRNSGSWSHFILIGRITACYLIQFPLPVENEDQSVNLGRRDVWASTKSNSPPLSSPLLCLFLLLFEDVCLFSINSFFISRISLLLLFYLLSTSIVFGIYLRERRTPLFFIISFFDHVSS